MKRRIIRLCLRVSILDWSDCVCGLAARTRGLVLAAAVCLLCQPLIVRSCPVHGTVSLKIKRCGGPCVHGDRLNCDARGGHCSSPESDSRGARPVSPDEGCPPYCSCRQASQPLGVPARQVESRSSLTFDLLSPALSYLFVAPSVANSPFRENVPLGVAALGRCVMLCRLQT